MGPVTDMLFDFAPLDNPALVRGTGFGQPAHGVPVFELTVRGTPAPQGSKKAFYNKRLGRAQLVEDNERTKPWRDRVWGAAVDQLGSGWTPIAGPVRLDAVFTMPKPKSAPKRRRTWPAKKPDLSKLIRAVEDSLTDAGVWGDDGQVVEYGRVLKAYPLEDVDALDSPGVRIRIYTIGETP